MKISMSSDIEALSSIKSRIPSVFEETQKTSRPKIVTQNGKAIGVMADIESYESLIRKVNLMKLIIEGEESFSHGEKTTISGLKKRMKEKYGFSSGAKSKGN